jgi:hypothetical protein
VPLPAVRVSSSAMPLWSWRTYWHVPPPLPALSRIFFHCRLQVGIIGAGRIGAAYARMMVEGHKMNLVYYDPYPNTKLEEYIKK